MIKIYPYVVKAEYYDEDINNYKKIYCLMYAKNAYDICKRIVRYCDPEHIEIDCVGDESQLFEVSEDIADAIIKGDGIYEYGIESKGEENLDGNDTLG